MAALASDPSLPPPLPDGLELSRIREALAPTLRLPEQEYVGQAQAAVALVLRAADPLNRVGVPELLLIRRAERADDPWSGHMALPGGRRDAGDASLLDTARREAFEEVGLRLDADAEHVGCLPTLPAMARGRVLGMTVTPLVFELTRPFELRVNDEVAETLWVRLDALWGGALDTFVDYPARGRQGAPLRLPAWSIDGRLVWGLTHRMITSFFDLLALGTRPHQTKKQGP